MTPLSDSDPARSDDAAPEADPDVAETAYVPASNETRTLGSDPAEIAARTPLEPGDVFGRYRIDSLLGRGGMGSVYLAHDTQLDRRVALKVPEFGGSTKEVVVERFQREARAAANLTHPNICPVYDVGIEEGRHFISMGYIEGRPLSDFVEGGRKQQERHVARVVRRIALAMQEAHEQGIVHRDLKPANVMIDRRGEPVVMDFGLAQNFEDAEATRITREGVAVGSPAYMSPEQVRAESLGPPTDIYSLGVVLYEMLTGRIPFDGPVVSVVGRILHDDPPSVQSHRSDLDDAIAVICHKAMSRRIEDRFASMREFADALGLFVKGDADRLQASLGLELPAEDAARLDLERRRSRATALIEDGQLREAANALRELATQADGPPGEVATWATEQLEQVEGRLQSELEESKSLFRRARKCLENHDYERALQLVERIPEDVESAAVRDLRAEARELNDEVERLTAELQNAVSTGEYDDVTSTVERLLELKPNHRLANEAYEQIVSTQPIDAVDEPAEEEWSDPEVPPPPPPRTRKRRRKKAKSNVPWAAIAIVGGLLAFVLVVLFNLPGGGDGTGADVADRDSTNSDPAETDPPDDHPPADQPADDDPGEWTGRDRPNGPDDRPRRFDFPKNPTPDEVFEALDNNRDGYVEGPEMDRDILDRIDTNRDGRVALPELRRSFVQVMEWVRAERGKPPRPFPRPFGPGPPRKQ